MSTAHDMMDGQPAGPTPLPVIYRREAERLTTAVDHTPRPHPESPRGELPLSFRQYRQNSQTHGPLGGKGTASATTASGAGTFESRSQLPSRFRYNELSEDEIENVNAGGAALVF